MPLAITEITAFHFSSQLPSSVPKGSHTVYVYGTDSTGRQRALKRNTQNRNDLDRSRPQALTALDLVNLTQQLLDTSRYATPDPSPILLTACSSLGS
jgi:hypothetical protein